MTERQMQIEVERRLQLMDPSLVVENKLSSDTIIAFINEAIDKYYKTRYSGINFKQQGFEQTQKRIDDLRTLIKTKVFSSDINEQDNTYTVTLPSDYVLLLGDTAGITPNGENDCWEKDNKGAYKSKIYRYIRIYY